LYCIISGDCGAIDTARHEDNTDVGIPALGRLLRQKLVLRKRSLAMKQHLTLTLLALLPPFASSAGLLAAEPGTAKPNILFIYSDDHAQQAISCYGSKVNTRPNIDLAPTFLDLAGLPIPASMQGHSLVPLLHGQTPADWRTSIYYRYYHDPGHHNTAAHYGVRTATHKLIYYWKKDAYELFDLTVDPCEQHNLLYAADEATKPEVAAKFAELKAEVARLQKLYKDDGQYADPAMWPAGSADGPFNDKRPIGTKSVAEAIAATVSE
jgi:hypothetical protein